MKKHDVDRPIPGDTIIQRIYVLRGQKVMLDRDLAEMYGIETRVLKQAVRRNLERFPPDFMFQMTKQELAAWRSQIVISNPDKMGLRHLPYVFTEQGVAMLSGVIHSPQAIRMNIAIMRAFVEMRKLLMDNNAVAEKIRQLFERVDEHDTQLAAIYDAIENLLDEKATIKSWENRERIGFK